VDVRRADVEHGVVAAAGRRGVARFEAHVAARQPLLRAGARDGDRVGVEIDAEPAPHAVARERAEQHLAAPAARVEHERAGRQAQPAEDPVDRRLAHGVGERQPAVGEVGGARHATQRLRS
jgi:hypothetical protein